MIKYQLNQIVATFRKLGTSFSRKAGFLSRCLSGPLLLICTVWTTLLLDAQTTRIVWSTILSHYPQIFRFHNCVCLKQYCSVWYLFTFVTQWCNISFHFAHLFASSFSTVPYTLPYHKPMCYKTIKTIITMASV